MKRWLPWFLPVLSVAFLVFAGRSTSPDLLQDTDSAAIIQGIAEERDPLAWFKQDWPLKNHFYRPVSTFAFYWDWIRTDPSDRPLRPSDASTFGTTNAVLAVVCILLCFWMLREVTDSPLITGLGALFFGVWHLGESVWRPVETMVTWLAPLCLLGVLRGGRRKVWPCVLAALGCLFLSSQLSPVELFSGRIVHWLPGRTASVMTVFALASIAMYARYVRCSAKFVPPPAASDDVPLTKSARIEPISGIKLTLLLCGSFVCLALALGSYEQAVMVPALAVGVWLLFRLRGLVSAWWPHVIFWGLLVGYMVLRSQLVPGDVSGYQEQQLRTGPGVWIVLGEYFAPFVYWTYTWFMSFGGAFILLLTAEFWPPVFTIAGNVSTYIRAWKDRPWKWWFVGFLLLSFVAFLPMAWLQPFGHYHYLPSAFRAAFVVALAAVVLRLVTTAASLPEVRAPQRLGPAPGSLLRP